MTRTSSRIHKKAIKTAKKEKRGFPLELKCDELSKYHMESAYRNTCVSFDNYIESISTSEQRKTLMDYYEIANVSPGMTYIQDKKDPRYFIFHDINTGTKTKVDITKSIPLHIKLVMARDMALIKKDGYKCLDRRVYIHNPTNTEVSVDDYNAFRDKKNCRATIKTPIGFEEFPEKIGTIPDGTDPRELRNNIKECIEVRIDVMSKCWSACSKNINTIRGHYNHLFKMIILGYIFDKKISLMSFNI